MYREWEQTDLLRNENVNFIFGCKIKYEKETANKIELHERRTKYHCWKDSLFIDTSAFISNHDLEYYFEFQSAVKCIKRFLFLSVFLATCLQTSSLFYRSVIFCSMSLTVLCVRLTSTHAHTQTSTPQCISNMYIHYYFTHIEWNSHIHALNYIHNVLKLFSLLFIFRFVAYQSICYPMVQQVVELYSNFFVASWRLSSILFKTFDFQMNALILDWKLVEFYKRKIGWIHWLNNACMSPPPDILIIQVNKLLTNTFNALAICSLYFSIISN